MRKIGAQLQKGAKKQQKSVEATIDKRLSHTKGKRQEESTSKFTEYPLANEEPVGQYASMHEKNPVETVVEQVIGIVDEQDVQELEYVATDKRVRFVRNREEDLSPPQRPPREPNQRPVTVVPPSRSPSSSAMYEPKDSQEDGEEEDGVQGETQGQPIQILDAQEEESLRIL